MALLLMFLQEFEDALAQKMPALQEMLEEPWIILYDLGGYLQRFMGEKRSEI